MGVVEIDNMLMLLSVSDKMTEKERDIVMPLMIQGFKVIKFLIEVNDFEVLCYRIVLKKQVQLSKVAKLPLILGSLLVVLPLLYVEKTK